MSTVLSNWGLDDQYAPQKQEQVTLEQGLSQNQQPHFFFKIVYFIVHANIIYLDITEIFTYKFTYNVTVE